MKKEITFTRQHYFAIQEVIRGLTALSPPAKRVVVGAFQRYFATTQEKFNAEAFLAGCYSESGPTEEENKTLG